MPGKAFTLIELLVVLIIMSIFTSLALPSFVNQVQRAKYEACFSDLADIVGMARYYAVEKGQKQEVIINIEQDELSLVKNGKTWIKKRLPSGLNIKNIKKGIHSIEYGVTKIIFLPDGTTEQTIIEVESQKKDKIIFELNAATGLLTVRA